MVDPVNIVMLLTDGFGGFGGIAKFNRDFMEAINAPSLVERVHGIEAWKRWPSLWADVEVRGQLHCGEPVLRRPVRHLVKHLERTILRPAQLPRLKFASSSIPDRKA